MKDPNRIDRMLFKVHNLWSQNPNERLMQLLINVARYECGVPEGELTILEDEKLLAGIEALIKPEPLIG